MACFSICNPVPDSIRIEKPMIEYVFNRLKFIAHYQSLNKIYAEMIKTSKELFRDFHHCHASIEFSL